MISVLAQERLLGAALGSALAGIVVIEQRKRIYDSISDESKLAAQSKVHFFFVFETLEIDLIHHFIDVSNPNGLQVVDLPP
ncbi:hypothetical protein SLA2020_379270 [Shorea laevis]